MDLLMHHRHNRDGGAAAPEQENLRIGIIDMIFEDLKVIGDEEIYKIVNSQQSSIEREVQE
jgi:hypothetical protein